MMVHQQFVTPTVASARTVEDCGIVDLERYHLCDAQPFEDASVSRGTTFSFTFNSFETCTPSTFRIICEVGTDSKQQPCE